MTKTHRIDPEQESLGPLIVNFRDRPLRWRDLLFTFIPCCFAVLTPLSYGLWLGYYGLTRHGRTAGYQWSRPWINLTAISLIPLILLAYLRIHRAHRYISIHKNGIKLYLGGWAKYKMPWSHFRGMSTSTLQRTFLGLPYKVQHRITLIPKKGRPIKIKDQVKNLPELAARLKGKIYPRLLPDLRSEYRSGQPIDFGTLTLNRQGLFLRGGRNPWIQVEHLSIKNGFMIIDIKNGGQKRLPVGDIPNLEILLQLITEGVNQ